MGFWGAAVAMSLLFVLADLIARALLSSKVKLHLGVRVATSFALFTIIILMLESLGWKNPFIRDLFSMKGYLPYFFAAVIADPVLCAVQSNRKIGALADKFFEGKCISSFANYVSLLGVPILCIAILYPPGMFLKKTFHYGVALLSFIALDILFRKLANLLAGVLEKVGSKG